jgi:hypothetical protein
MKSTVRTIAAAWTLAAGVMAHAAVGPSVEEPAVPAPQVPAAAATQTPTQTAPATEPAKPEAATQSAPVQPEAKPEAKPENKPETKPEIRPEPTKAATKPAKARALPDSQRPLGLPASTDRPAAAKDNASASSWSIPSWATQLGALILVVGIILATGKLIARFGPSAGLMAALGPRGKAPSGVLEVLGRYPVSRGSMLVLLKLDRRILLVSQQSGRGGTTMQTLTEITDPAEVASLVARTADGSAPSARAFANTLERVGGAAIATPAASAPQAASSMPRQPVASKTPAASAAPRRKAAEPSLIELDGAAAAQALRTRLAAMQAAPAPAAASTSTREFTA